MKKQNRRGASVNMLKSLRFTGSRNPTTWLNRNQFGATSLFVSVRHRPEIALRDAHLRQLCVHR